jgi:MFS family permease
LLRDHEFLGFVTVNVGITFLALAVPTALPVFLVKILGLAAWSPGAALALNAVLVAMSAAAVMSVIFGRRRRNVLMASQACLIATLAALLAVHLLPAAAAVSLVLLATLPLAACEVMQGAVVPAVVTESATPLTLGRYTSAYQVTFSIADIICPAVVTVALRAGAAALWLPLAAVALLDLAAVGLLARRMPALTQRVGQALPEPASPAEHRSRPTRSDQIATARRTRRAGYGCSGDNETTAEARDDALAAPDWNHPFELRPRRARKDVISSPDLGVFAVAAAGVLYAFPDLVDALPQHCLRRKPRTHLLVDAAFRTNWLRFERCAATVSTPQTSWSGAA